MQKPKSAFFCQNCGYETPKWTGKCPSCASWNTLVEELVQKEGKQKNQFAQELDNKEAKKAHLLQDIPEVHEYRLPVPDPELSRVLGGGMVPGSVILVAGEPGIGKSTLFLQIALQWQGITTLYVSGEESAQQIKLRARRIDNSNNPNLYLLTATDTHTLFQEAKKHSPHLIIIDSIQTLESPYIESAAGSVSQVRECAAELQRYAKLNHVTVIIIGHITKEGVIAGPKVLEHIVDTVLQFEGDRHYAYRLLRTLKNRFGSTSELGIYEMVAQGMRPVSNPSEILLSQHSEPLSGIAIAATMEGLRPLMIEVQALATPAVYGTPQRTVSGFDPRRLQLLLAVLDKRGGFAFAGRDVFVNIAGGIKVEDPSVELAIVCALLSTYEDKALPTNICLVGEVGLSGEIRAVNRIDQRIAEADKLGMDAIWIPKANAKGLTIPHSGIAVNTVNKVEDVYRMLF